MMADTNLDSDRDLVAQSELPEWDLGDLFKGPNDPALEAAFANVTAAAKKFAEDYKGRIASIDGEALARAIAEFEEIQEALGRVSSYAQLLFAADASSAGSARFYQTVNERVTEISADILFFDLEINQLDDADFSRKLEAPGVARYAPWLTDVRAFRPHQLSEDLERLLHEKSVVGRGAWSRLFDETMAALRFPLAGKELTSSEIFDLMSDQSPAVRKDAAKSIAGVLGENVRLFAMITNTLAKDKAIEDAWRRYNRPISQRNLINQVEDDVVEALVKAVKESYSDLSHRYYALKAKWFGVDKLDYWDRNAPLPESDDRRISWSDAEETVFAAYSAFEPKLGDLVQRFFDRPWIDARPRPGKDSGAFSHPTVPSAHPYILLNYQGRTRDVMTLAHELGHGVHQLLAAPQGYLLADTPLTLAETASVFGEMLTFRSLVASTDDVARRRVMIASKVEDMLNTVVRQIAFHEFERQVHDERRSGELSSERLGEIWLSVQTESLGPAFRFDDEYALFWSYIPHFIHAPFYVYAYAFGDCLVNSLYQLYREGFPDFQPKYLDMLKAGGTLRHRELLAPFGLDASDPEFWHRGLRVIAGFIDELEAGA